MKNTGLIFLLQKNAKLLGACLPAGRVFGLFMLLLCYQASTAQYVIHIAGNNSCLDQGDGGSALRASVNAPYSICRDNAGNLYIGDQGAGKGGLVRKINAATGIITTFAGGGPATATNDNISATSAYINAPSGICIDAASNNLYIADDKYRIRMVNLASGIITTAAGNDTAIHGGLKGDGGPATNATLYNPRDVAIDAANNIYIADYYNNAIRKVTAATGIITTVAGTGFRGTGFGGNNRPATADSLDYPAGVCLDNAGNIYIAEANRIRKVTVATGIITTVAGNDTAGFSGDGGQATAAKLYNPLHLTCDKTGYIYIADYGNARIRMVNASSGIITTYAGTGSSAWIPTTIDSIGDGGPATAAQVMVRGICLDTCGNLFFTDQFCRVRAVTASLPVNYKLCNFTYNNTAGVVAPPFGKPTMTVYPNPNNGLLTVNVSSGTEEEARIIITNAMGQKVKEITARTNRPEEIEISGPPGVYFIGVITENGTWIERVVVKP